MIPCFQNKNNIKISCVYTELYRIFCLHFLNNCCDHTLLTNLEMAATQEDVCRVLCRCLSICVKDLNIHRYHTEDPGTHSPWVPMDNVGPPVCYLFPSGRNGSCLGRERDSRDGLGWGTVWSQLSWLTKLTVGLSAQFRLKFHTGSWSLTKAEHEFKGDQQALEITMVFLQGAWAMILPACYKSPGTRLGEDTSSALVRRRLTLTSKFAKTNQTGAGV